MGVIAQIAHENGDRSALGIETFSPSLVITPTLSPFDAILVTEANQEVKAPPKRGVSPVHVA